MKSALSFATFAAASAKAGKLNLVGESNHICTLQVNSNDQLESSCAINASFANTDRIDALRGDMETRFNALEARVSTLEHSTRPISCNDVTTRIGGYHTLANGASVWCDFTAGGSTGA
jgi:hypothetical protein